VSQDPTHHHAIRELGGYETDEGGEDYADRAVVWWECGVLGTGYVCCAVRERLIYDGGWKREKGRTIDKRRVGRRRSVTVLDRLCWRGVVLVLFSC